MTQVTSEAAEDRTRYPASEEDLETVDCFLDFQLMGELSKRRRYPVTEFLVSRQAP